MMDENNQSLDDELKIVVRKNEYYVSKKFICSSVPYFEKMFCGDISEPRENIVTLDFDEHVFDSIINWIHSGSFLIQMESVIDFYKAADHLMLNECLFEPCVNYFYNNFTIEHLPVVLHQVMQTSKLISSEAINYFICRNFLMISNTNIFLTYPSKTVEHILKLDLFIYSEYQVFESIMKWVNKKINSRKGLLPQLLDCVRWSFMDPVDITKIKDNKLIKTLPNPDLIISSNSEYGFNRSQQNFFISIDQIDDSKLRINVFDNELFSLPIGYFAKDDSMPLKSIHDEHISDIFYDSGREGVRINWIKKTFRWFDFEGDDINYYIQLFDTTVQFLNRSSHLNCYLGEKGTKPSVNSYRAEYVLLESVDRYIVIGKTEADKKWFGLFPALDSDLFHRYNHDMRTFHATILDNVVYILTKELEFIQYNCETRSFDKSYPFKDEELDFDDLILTSHQTKDDKVLLINKSSGKISFFCINQKKWIEKYRIMNVNFCSNSSNVRSNQLIAFTSTFLRMKNIKPLYKRNSCSL